MLQRSGALLASVVRVSSTSRSATGVLFNCSRNYSKNNKNITYNNNTCYDVDTHQYNHTRATPINLQQIQRRMFSSSQAVQRAANMTPISELSPEEANRVRQVLPDHSELVALIESQMPQLSDSEFTALMDATRENKMAHSKLPSLEDARQLIFGYLKRGELDAAWVTYLDLKTTLKSQQQVLYNDKLVYDALLVYYGLHQKFNYADTVS
jgi:hypothetical protein